MQIGTIISIRMSIEISALICTRPRTAVTIVIVRGWIKNILALDISAMWLSKWLTGSIMKLRHSSIRDTIISSSPHMSISPINRENRSVFSERPVDFLALTSLMYNDNERFERFIYVSLPSGIVVRIRWFWNVDLCMSITQWHIDIRNDTPTPTLPSLGASPCSGNRFTVCHKIDPRTQWWIVVTC